MNAWESLSHTSWKCKYHVLFIPKCQMKALFWKLRPQLGKVLRELARQKECETEERFLMADHVLILVRIPPKYAASQVAGYLKGRVRSTLRERMVAGAGILLRSSFGREDIGFRPLEEMKRQCGFTPNSRNRKINGSIN